MAGGSRKAGWGFLLIDALRRISIAEEHVAAHAVVLAEPTTGSEPVTCRLRCPTGLSER